MLHSLDEMLVQLRRRGFDSEYVARLRDEITDHVLALEAEYLRRGQNAARAAALAERQIGDWDVLYEEVVRRAGPAPWMRRFPALFFGLGPVLITAAVAGLLVGLGALALTCATGWFGVTRDHAMTRHIVLRSFDLLAYGLTPLLALTFARCAVRFRCHYAWAVLACLVLSLVGGLVRVYLVWCPASGSIRCFYWCSVDTVRLVGPMAACLLYAAAARLRSGPAAPLPEC